MSYSFPATAARRNGAGPSFLTQLWQEVSRGAALETVLERMACLAADHLPLAALVVRRIDLERATVETIAIGLAQPVALNLSPRSALEPGAREQLLLWARQKPPFEFARLAETDGAPGLIPHNLEAPTLVAPIAGDEVLFHALIAIAPAGHEFQAGHLSAFESLISPLEAALQNERRLRELIAQREAAEADKQALLNKLGRHDISDAIIGATTGLSQVLERVSLVAATDAPVLILGETGSGKEVVARAIHQQSARSSGPFVRVNCGAIPPELIDSELFGHERGSFTGAVSARRGWFERADKGTLFLDECGELPPAIQVRLLRVLQDGTFERVGAERPLQVDVRIVAATNRDLHAMVDDGSFRQDLWYRLAVFPIRLPPLRERLEDVPAMAAYFAQRSAQRLGLSPRELGAEEIELLQNYHWPGNVRELAAVVERATILGQGRRLEVRAALGQSGAASAARLPNVPVAPAPVSATRDETFPTLNQVVARHIEHALRLTGGIIEGRRGAAHLLGINPHTLRARMRKLRIDWQSFRSAPQ